ncbi:MAG: PEP-CTERM sorting domain-containing protein [Verrucomicrobia bacterium]|nr:PEP-CTERM sorting domain-containing protein [Verrucomicrobiota bacterium]
MKTPWKSLSLVAFLAATLASSHAATITWATPTAITANSDVYNSGTLVMAYNVGTSTSTTVNGVTFAGFSTSGSSTTVGNATLSTTTSFGSYNGFGEGATGVWPTLSSNYQTLLTNSTYANSEPGTFTLTLSGLTNGQNYVFQIWQNDSRNYGYGRESLVTGGANSVTLKYNVGNGTGWLGYVGGTGQFVTGTFTADSTSQVFTILGTGSGNFGVAGPSTQLAAFQLQAVPEPTTWALLGAGLTVVTIFRRRRA